MALTPDSLESVPRLTGVYLLKDASGRVIYVGKARDLRGRLRTYIAGDDRPYTQRIVAETADIDFITTRNESEALLLENQLIKANKPRYNIDLKDDKSYVRIRVGVAHPWPSIGITRTTVSDGSLYFGPYPSAQATRRTLSVLGRVFPLRRCKDSEFRQRVRPCLYHSIGLCLAPCVNPSVRAEYDQATRDLVAFLQGRDTEVVRRLRKRMEKAAEALDFEEAARIRDRIAAIESTLVPQAVVGTSPSDSHVFAFFETRDKITASVLKIQDGSLVGSTTLTAAKAAQEDPFSMIILQFYLSGADIPGTVHVDSVPLSRRTLQDALTRLRGSRVAVVHPKRGRPLDLLEIARDNARSHAKDTGSSSLEEIARVFHLRSIPHRMECYDVSTLRGTDSTASRAVFVAGEPAKDLYRRYRIRLASLDDFSMLKEIFERRFAEDESRPDLVIVDGGKAQLGVLLRVMTDLGCRGIPVASIAKARGTTPDRFYLPGRRDAVVLPRGSAALRTLQRIRDEAHRFAVKYHRHLRSRRASSPLESIPGIGKKKARAILMLTASVADPAAITREDLEGLGCLRDVDVERVLAHLKGNV